MFDPIRLEFYKKKLDKDRSWGELKEKFTAERDENFRKKTFCYLMKQKRNFLESL